jgi:hypothetical protein
MFWFPSPDLCLDRSRSLSSMDNSFDLMAWFFLWQVCAFQNHVQWIAFTTGGLISSSIPSLIAKCLNTYVNKILMCCFYICKILKKTCLHFVIMGCCV